MSDSTGARQSEFGDLGDLARRVDDQGKHVWRQRGPDLSEASRRFGYVAAIVVNGLMFYVVHHLLDWNVPFITEAWPSVLWAVDLSIAAVVIVNAAYLAYNPRWFRHVGSMVSSAFSFVSAYTVWKVFPFDFGAYDQLVQFALAVALVGLVIAIVVESVQLIVGQNSDR